MSSRSRGMFAASAVLIVVALTAALGVHALQVRRAEHVIAQMPVVEMERVVIIGERAHPATGDTPQVAKTPTSTLH